MNRSAISVVFAAVVVVYLAACSPPPPYRVGFLGSLSGSLADLSTAVRNGVILAVEEANRNGGLSGRMVELVLGNDEGDAEAAIGSMNYFTDQQVKGIIGPLTVEMSRITVPWMLEKNMVMITPSAHSVDFQPEGDAFFRISPSDSEDARHAAELAFHSRGYRRISILYDLTNREFAQGRVLHFRNRFEGLGGVISQVTTYTTRDDTDFGLLAGQVSKNNPDAVYIVTPTADLAQICIQLKMMGQSIPVLTDGQSVNESLIETGGVAVEGLEFFQPFDLYSSDGRFQTFARQYEDRFHEKPEMGSVFGYEAAQILLTGINQAQNRKKIAQTIHTAGTFEGLQHELVIAPDGTVSRPLLHRTILNGRIVTVGKGSS